jgi:formylglycine-generating enzyme required for sulfatase activity
MGRVYLYKDTKLQRDVAIKFVRELANRAAILSEAQAAAQVRHPGVVAIHEVDEESGFIVFEYVDGQPLHACIPVSSDRLLPLARDIARALAEVHGKGLVHGDIKPANIMLETATASPKLIDFGLAFHHDESLASDESPVAGTPAFLAPELQIGSQPSPASDVYAFGVLLHQLGTGELPRVPRSAGPARDHERARDGDGPALPWELDDLIDDCLATDPSVRPRDGRAVLERLRRLRQWLDAEDDRQLARQRLQRDAVEWEHDGHSADLLWNKRRLHDARELSGGTDLTTSEVAFLAASRRRLWHARLVRAAVVAGIISLVALVATGVRARLLRDIEHQVQIELGSYEQARRALRDVRGRREVILDRLRHDVRDEAALAGWPGVLAELTDLESEFHRIDMSLDAALLLAPELDLLRQAAASLAYERMQLARDLERTHDVRQLEARVNTYAAESNRCLEPVAVALELHPISAAVAVHRYETAADGRFTLVPHGEHTLRQPALRLALAPGSYLVTVQADATHVELRYPLHLDCEAAPIAVTLVQPRRDEIPPGFVYIPAGPVRYGFGRNPDQEMLRTWLETVPLHERTVGAHLIARHETTFQQWIDFLDACARSTCDGLPARPPRVSAAFPGESPLQLIHTESGWLLEIRPDPKVEGMVHRAGQSQKLIYPARQQPHHEQRWERMPVTGVSWDDIELYLRWLHTSGRVPGARLCREDEWERAARGADGRLYPHGNTLQPGDANHDRTYDRKPMAYGLDEVGAHPASDSPFGLHDMAGNAWEMVAPLRDDDRSAGYRVLRGGSYYHSALDAVAANRWMIERSDSDSRVGFRICAPPPATDSRIIEK